LLKEQHQLFRTVLVATDAIFVMAALIVAYWLRFEIFGHVSTEVTWLTWLGHDVKAHSFATRGIPLVCVFVMAFSLFNSGLYLPRRDQRFWREAIVIVKAVFIGTILSMAVVFLFRKQLFDNRDPSRMQFALFGALSAVSLLCWRFSFRTLLKSLRRRGWNLRHVAIIGTGRLGQVVYHTLERNSWTGIKPRFFISHHPQTNRALCCGLPVRGGVESLREILDSHIDEISGIFIAVPQRMISDVPRLLGGLEKYPIDVRVVPDVNPKHTPFSMATSELEGMPILTVRQSPLQGWGRVFKRGVDMTGAAVAILLFSPIMALIAALVCFSGPGPIMFRQPRASLGGRRFMMYKFRTMSHVDAELQEIRDAGRGVEAWTQPNDPRITPIGRILRRTSLDELPQLFNVLLGEMSLVGPRPERPELITRFREDWRGYMLRQHVKAGMTGWAQVNGLRGNSSLRKRLQYDLHYIRHWSLGFDFRILWLTMFKGFVGPNAE